MTTVVFYRIYDRRDVHRKRRPHATSTCGSASNLLLRADNAAKCLVVASQDGEGQLGNSRESGAQVEEMTRAWQEVSAAGSRLQSPSLATLAPTPAPGKLAHLRSAVERSHAACPSETEETMQRLAFLFFIRLNFPDKIKTERPRSSY